MITEIVSVHLVTRMYLTDGYLKKSVMDHLQDSHHRLRPLSSHLMLLEAVLLRKPDAVIFTKENKVQRG